MSLHIQEILIKFEKFNKRQYLLFFFNLISQQVRYIMRNTTFSRKKASLIYINKR